VNRRAGLALAVLAILVCLGPTTTAQNLAAQAVPGRQVTLFGILATPSDAKVEVDPRLKKIEPQLRKLFPDNNYSFKLLATESKRLGVGDVVTCKLGDGFVAGTQLVSIADIDGNLQLKFALEYEGEVEFTTIVRTPPNQLFFCDKALPSNGKLPNGSKLLIGLGGR
jgi:hypothetical protein